MSYTKGPWTFEKKENWHIRDAEGNSMMCDEQYYPWVPSNEADWHVMAAAPELLEALKAIVPAYDDARAQQHGHDLLEQARAAIAKAEGKS